MRRFDDRLCEAIRLLTPARRVVLLRLDSGDRVRVRGAAGMGCMSWRPRSRPLADIPSARAALEEDRVIVDPRATWTPEELAVRGDSATVAYIPVSAGRHRYGVFLADSGDDVAAPTEAERADAWTLGKMAALALGARVAALEDEVVRAAGRRRRLGRELERKVTERMLSVADALRRDDARDSRRRRRYLEELDAAHATLRRVFTRWRRAAHAQRAFS